MNNGCNTIPGLFFRHVYTPVSNNRSIVPEPYCNSIIFINIGQLGVVTINGFIILNPGNKGINNGETFAFGGNWGEIFDGRIDITWDAFPNGQANQQLLIIQKIYIEPTRSKIIL